MNKRNLLLGMGAITFLGMTAASPYQGAALPADGSADFYMYQVESGKWMQANQGHLRDKHTTHAALGSVGFDLEVKKIDGGYQLNPKFGGNNSIAGGNDRFYMDTGQPVTVWEITPVSKDGVTNGYQIKAVGGEGNPENSLLGESEGRLQSYAETNNTWQFVTREARINVMKSQAASGEADATWLIPGNDFSANDSRNRLWTLSYSGNSNVTDGGVMSNKVREAWNNAVNYVHYIVLEGLPKGTYKLNVQGYYRDGKVDDAEFHQRIADGAEVQRAIYFAGANEGKLMPLSKMSSPDQVEGQFTFNIESAGIWVPNSLGDASNAFNEGLGFNQWIDAIVTDGTLIIGISKPEGIGDDWLVYDNFQLKYVSDATPEVDCSSLKTQLAEVIATAEKQPATPAITAALAKANEAKAGNNPTDIRLAMYGLYKLIAGITSAKSEIESFNATKKITDAAGIDVSSAMEMFNTAETRDDFVSALRQLRYLRRAAAAFTQEDVFPGHAPEAGQFYLYNVGKKQFLCGGADWGAHAALGMPGILLTLEPANTGDEPTFSIETGLYNGDDKHYLNYRGYMDAPQDGAGGGWKFIPVEGKENVFNIAQGDWQDAYMTWDPYANTDGGQGNETTVSTECRSPKFDEGKNNPNAQWKLVTKAEREALLEKAALKNPVDATFTIIAPGFNQREPVEAWAINNGAIWERGNNHNDFCLESWNSTDFDASQVIEGLPAGVYTLYANGFYRNGRHNTTEEVMGQADLEPLQNAFIYAGAEGEAYLPNILSESFNAPGEGGVVTSAEGTKYEIPGSCDEAANYFRSGLYPVHFTIEKGDEDLVIGVGKETQGEPEDWVVVDNFRLIYYGADTTVEEVENQISSGIEDVTIESVERPADNRIFNIHGIEVKNPTAPGIYIRNGEKFIVR